MGNKKTIPSGIGDSGKQIITNGTMTGTATVLGPSAAVSVYGFGIQNLDNVGIRLAWTGTPIGTFSVECSVNAVDWDALTFNPALTQPAGGSGSSYLINLNQVPYPYVRLKYVNTSGTGTLNAWISGKDLN